MIQNIVSMKDTIILVHILPMKKMLKMSKLDGFPRKNDQNDATQVKLFIMTMKSLLEVQNTNSSEYGCYLIYSCPTFSNIGHS